MNQKPPCAGMYSLFDSPRVDDHKVAKKLCKTCPVILECRRLLRDVQAASTGGAGGGPQGTWAGKLIGRPQRKPVDTKLCSGAVGSDNFHMPSDTA